MSTVAEIIAQAEHRLEGVTETPRLDAEILLAHSLALTRSQLLIRLSEDVASAAFDAMLDRRLAHEPIAYILGEWEFFSLPFTVEAPILVPRPETEHLVEVVLEFVQDRAANIIEIGTGSGCVSVAIAANAPNAMLIATDCNAQCIDVATKNALRNDVYDRITFVHGDCFRGVSVAKRPYDVVCSNPPYIADDDWLDLPRVVRDHEDPIALLAGEHGLDMVHRIAGEAGEWLRRGGLLALEIGMGQYEAAMNILENNGFQDIEYRCDLAGIERIVFARKPS